MTSTADKLDHSVLERIKKLHDKAVSAKEIGSEHEALAFAAAAQKMLLLHSLEDISEVEQLLREKQDPVKAHYFRPGKFGIKPSKVRVAWQERLCRAVCTAYQCDYLIVKGNTYLLVGTRENREICEYMLVFLLRFATDRSYRDYCRYFYHCRDELGDVTLAKGYRAGWYLGFVGCLIERYAETMQEAIIEHDNQTGKTGHGLMVINRQLALVQTVKDSLSIGKLKGISGREASDEGIIDGIAAADKVNLGKGLSGQDKTRSIDTGQRLLSQGA